EVLGIVHVSAIEHEQIRSEARPADRKLGAPALIRTATCRRRHSDTGLQVDQLIDAAAIQRQVAYLFFVNQPSHRSGGRLLLSAASPDFHLIASSHYFH